MFKTYHLTGLVPPIWDPWGPLDDPEPLGAQEARPWGSGLDFCRFWINSGTPFASSIGAL